MPDDIQTSAQWPFSVYGSDVQNVYNDVLSRKKYVINMRMGYNYNIQMRSYSK